MKNISIIISLSIFIFQVQAFVPEIPLVPHIQVKDWQQEKCKKICETLKKQEITLNLNNCISDCLSENN